MLQLLPLAREVAQLLANTPGLLNRVVSVHGLGSQVGMGGDSVPDKHVIVPASGGESMYILVKPQFT
jgi:hypothetical protein